MYLFHNIKSKYFKMKNIISLVAIMLFISCSDKKENQQGVNHKDNSELMSKVEKQEDIDQSIINLARKKDSLLKVLDNTKQSMTRMNDEKIDKGIEGVNQKLNELKGQKENLDEQVNLQKKEIDLATKKIDLLKEEKVVYDQQHKALWDKGAAPKEFKSVDSLLNGINSKIAEQTKRVKFLNRNVADIEEQVLSIDQQRNFLSTKIRENYNAQEIFAEFANEEEYKIKTQIDLIDSKISDLKGNSKDLNSEIANMNADLANANAKAESDKKGKNRMIYALIAIGFITLIFGFLYWIGKKRKTKK